MIYRGGHKKYAWYYFRDAGSFSIKGYLRVAVMLGSRIWMENNVLFSNLTSLDCQLLGETLCYPKIFVSVLPSQQIAFKATLSILWQLVFQGKK